MKSVMPDAPAAFRFEQFEDYLTFERGLSERTVVAYGRDLARWVSMLSRTQITNPAAIDVRLLRA